MTASDAHADAGEAYCPSCDRSYTPDLKLCPNDGTKLVDLTRPADPMIGRQIDGRFTIKERLGAGGMGVVYRAWQASVGREVAVKVIAPRPGDDSSTAKRFLREAKLLRGGSTPAPADAAPRATIPAAADASPPAADAAITVVDAGVSVDAGKPRGKDKERDPRPRKVDAGAATRPPPIDAAPAVRIKIDAGLFVDPE